MAHLWVQTAGSDAWEVLPLEASAVFLDADGRTRADNDALEAPAALLRVGVSESWLLSSREDSGVRLNGAPVPGGLAALRDRDEIRARAGARLFFSTERLLAVAHFPSGLNGSACPRCKQPLEEGQQTVRCPQCGIWHHELDDLPCWTYAERCALCDQPTTMDSGYRWTPHGL